MAKMPMLRVEVAAHKTKRKAILEYLQRSERVEILDEGCREGFFRQDTEAEVQSFERNRKAAERALAILDEYAPVKKGMLSGFKGRREVSPAEFARESAREKAAVSLLAEIAGLQETVAETRGEISRKRALIPQYAAWENLDIPTVFTGTDKTAAFFGVFPGSKTLPEIYEAVGASFGEPFCVEIEGVLPEQTAVFAVCRKADAGDFEAALRGAGFAAGAPVTHHTPAEKTRRLEAEIAALEEKSSAAAEKIRELAGRRAEIELACDSFTAREEKYRVIAELDQTKSAFVVTGYVAERDFPRLERDLTEKFGAVVECSPAGDDAPVRLQSNAFTAPAAGITAMYAMPGKGDIDPTPLMSFFYYLLFGMMLSDAGYGLLLLIGSLLLIKIYKPEEKMRRNLQLFAYCGVSTCFWGVMFGSYFGNAIPTISEFFFGHRVNIPPVLFDPMEGTSAVTMLILSLALGLVMVVAGLAANIYTLSRNGDPWEGILGSGSWILVLLGVAALAVGFVSFAPLKTAGIAAAALGVLMLFANGVRKKGFLGIFSGLVSLYDVTGYASDLMSFSRLMALGLTTAAMSQVFNQLCTLGGKGFFGTVLFIVVFVVGHLINFALNALGAYVHTLRLQYVELFSKFYEGGGRAFEPFSGHTKYIKVREDE